MFAFRRPTSIIIAALALGALAMALVGALFAPARAAGHRDAVYDACMNNERDAQACACLADAYARELSDAELAFYARLLARAGQPDAMQEVARELGLSRDQIPPMVRRQAEVDARARRACGLGNAG